MPLLVPWIALRCRLLRSRHRPALTLAAPAAPRGCRVAPQLVTREQLELALALLGISQWELLASKLVQAGDGSEIVEPAVIGQWSPPTLPVQCSCTSIIRSHAVNNASSPLKSQECQQRWVPKSRLEEFSLIASSRAQQGFQGGRTVPPRRSSMATTLPPSSSIGAFLLNLEPDKQNLNVSTNSELFND